ncbi:hypothetical protein HanPI659440_Chr11g0429261 [Helianthus annuus]|nr:hypothetical protein HanPI659440_Chr11g0429261 [Helianthus annuus]
MTAESLIEPLKNNMLWMQHHGIINVANAILNSIELDQFVAKLMVTARHDGYAQGYAECSQHVTNALKVDWDTSQSATSGVNTNAVFATAKKEYNSLRIPVMDLVTNAQQHENYVDQLKEVFPDEAETSDDEDLD